MKKSKLKITDHDFMCIHGKERVRAEAVYAEAKRRLGTTDDTTFLSDVVYGLEIRFDKALANITGMYADQWAGVAAKGMVVNPEDERKFVDDVTIFIQCDLVEHGVAAVFLFFDDRYGSVTSNTESEDA